MRCGLGLWLMGLAMLAQAQSNPFPNVASAYRVEINNAVVWEKQGAQRLAPASLTKLMTALLVLESDQLQATVAVSRSAARESGTRLGLRLGEQLRVRDLLAATLIASANDACLALAEHLAGGQASFVQRMNLRAQALGLRNTHFANACGHDAPGHYSSAQDLAVLAHSVLQFPVATELAAQAESRIATLNGARHYRLLSTNALVGRYAGATGLKTGHTAQAGNCLIAVAQRDGTQVLLVLLHGANRWWDAVDLLDLAFAHAAHPR